MRTAATEIVFEICHDLFVTRRFRFGEEGRALHDHPIDAVAALDGLLGDEGGLERMSMSGGSETFEGDDFRVPDRTDGNAA